MPKLEIRTLTSSERFRSLTAYGVAALLSILILVCVMRLWNADLKIPFEYGGDTMYYSMLIKGTIENGWYLNNSSVGAPDGLEMRDFPMADAFNFLLIKLLSVFSSDYALIYNVFYLLTFPLVTLSSLFVFRHFKISYLTSLLGSLLYSFLPYHFFRNEHHLFLSTYYMIPLVVLVALWICSGTSFLTDDGENARRPKLKLRSSRFISSLVICLIASSVGWVYYAFFSCFFLLVAAVSASIYQRNAHHLLVPVILIAVIFIGLIANLSPSLIYFYNHGDSGIARRVPQEAEFYGLKITQMLLPMSDHRIAPLKRLKERYNSGHLVNENDNSSLGVVGSLGFLTLLGWLLYWKPQASKMESAGAHGVLNHLSVLNIFALLLATIGGFGSLFSLFISPQIRTYNRISVFIAFFSIFAVVLMLESLASRLLRPGGSALIFRVFLCLIFIVGILDQTGKGGSFVPNYAGAKSTYIDDANFFSKVEAILPKGSLIYQLPFVPFPEQPPVYDMPDYEHFKSYLHTRTLRWSYGAIKGRPAGLLQKRISEQPIGQLLETIALVGYSGVYINRGGYQDRAAELEAKISNLTGVTPITSDSGRLAYFNLTDYNKSLKEKLPPEVWEIRRQALHSLEASWGGGFSDLEGTPENNWRWCSAKGELYIHNISTKERKVKIEMTLNTAYEEFANLSIQGLLLSEQLRINVKHLPYARTLTVPPGQHAIKFTCDAPRVNAPRDPRYLVFKVMKFKFEEVK